MSSKGFGKFASWMRPRPFSVVPRYPATVSAASVESTEPISKGESSVTEEISLLKKMIHRQDDMLTQILATLNLAERAKKDPEPIQKAEEEEETRLELKKNPRVDCRAFYLV